MAIRNLYVSIYLTMLAVLLVFALVGGLLVRNHTASERARFDAAMDERAQAWAQLLQSALPAATESERAQREGLLQWAERLRLPLALDDAQGRRIATSDFYGRLESEAEEAATSVRLGTPVAPARGVLRDDTGLRMPLPDGRGLWVATRKPKLPIGMTGPWIGGPPGPRDQGPRTSPQGEGGPPQAPGLIGRPGDMPGPGPAGLEPGGAPRESDRGPRGWLPRWLDDAGTLLALLLGALFVAVAAGAYPVARRLTRRLEALEHGVEIFGSGQLSHRVPQNGHDEVAALGASFNRAAERIEQLVRASRSLLANASHELRSPLARLKMAVAMQDSVDPARRAELRAEIDHNIRELDELVEEVLLASRLDAQGMSIGFEPVDLLGVLAEEAARVGGEAGGDAVMLNGDERLLRRAMRNLLENARRYGGGGEIEAVLERRGDLVELAVLDRGPGVPAEHRERIFEPFFRLPGHAERAGGVGLGLSLVRQIALQHGGSVRCEPRAGGGSRFVISLPLDR